MKYIKAHQHKTKANLFYDEEPMLPSISVDDHECVDTGLLWEDGSPVLRAPNPIGFGRDEDW